MLDRLYDFFSSLKLTVALLALGLVLVFVGTVAQVNLGLYKAQNDFFRSFIVYWGPAWSSLRIPVFPGGYTIGWLLLMNLFAAHFRHYRPGQKKYGIILIHFGVVLLLVGQLLTDMFSTESLLHLRNGDTKNYSEASREFELAIVDTTAADSNQVVVISTHRLRKGGDIQHPALPFTVRVKTFFANSSLVQTATPGYQAVPTTTAFRTGLWWRELPHETEMEKRDMPSALVELHSAQGTVGTFLFSAFLTKPHAMTHAGRTYQLVVRQVRFYKPFSIHLVEFRHDRYPGTEIPKNFSSRVRLQRPDTGEDREVLIFMNNPLRYDGETYYQASFDTDDQGTVLQVVRNPSWLTPYFSCVLVGLGLIVQFTSHLVGFARKRSKV